MNFSISTGDLQRAIKLLGVVAKANTLDSTGMVLIGTEEDGTVTFLANNNSTAITFNSTECQVKDAGMAAVEYGKIRSFVMSFPGWNENYGVKDFKFLAVENALKISVENQHENGKISKGNLKLRTFDPYTVRMPQPFTEPNFVLSSSVFRSATSKVIYAINPGEGPVFIQGMNVHFDKDRIYFVGTNGKTLSEYKVKNLSDLTEGSFLLRYDFIMGLRRALGEEAPVEFEFEDRSVKARFDRVCFWGKTIVGHEFPDYKPVLEKYEHTIRLDKEILMSSLRPMADLLNSEDNYRLTFELVNRNMKLFNDVAAFEYGEEVDYAANFAIDVNGLYMLNTIEIIEDDQIIIKFSDDKGVIIFASGNFEDQEALITPIRRR